MNENEVIGIDLYNQCITGGVAKTLNSRATDSDHLPCVIVRCATLKIRGGCETDRYGKKAGKGALVQWERSGTLGVSQDQTLIVWNEDLQKDGTSKR